MLTVVSENEISFQGYQHQICRQIFYICFMRTGWLLLILLSLLLFPGLGLGQNHTKDSIRASYYFRKFQDFEYKDTMKSRIYTDSALFFAYRTGSDELKGRAHQFKGWFYQDCSRFKDANAQFYKSLAFLKRAGNEQGVADAYGNLGNSFLDMNEFQKSLDYQQLSLAANDKIIASKPDKEALEWAKEGRTYALHNIAAIFQEIGLYDKALEYEYASLSYEFDAQNMVGVAIAYNTLGTLHNSLGHQDSAIYYFKKALDVYKTEDYPYGLASTLHEYALMKGTDLTEEQRNAMLHKSLEIRKKLGDVDGEVKLILDIGKERFDKLSTDSLGHILEQAYEYIHANDLEYLSESYFKLYSNYNSRIGRYDSAYFALENFLELKEISDAKKHTNDLIAQDIRFQWETKSFNDSLKLANRFAEGRLADQKEINKKQNYIYLSVIGLIVVLVSLFFFVLSNRRSRKMNEILSDKNRQINEQKEIVEEHNRSISDSINYARRLQTAILPTREEVNDQLPESFLLYKPKDVVSGDFHWFEAKEDVILIAAADCTGHGVPGAMVSVVCSNALNQAVNEFGLTSPARILDKTRELVIRRFEKSGDMVVDGMDIVLCALSKDKKKLLYSGANNPLWIIRKNELIDRDKYSLILELGGVSLIELKGDKQPVGLYAKMDPFSEWEVPLYPGDSVYLSTDGFADQFGGEHGKKFKYAAFKRVLLEINHLSMTEQKEHLDKLFEAWKGDLEQVDDLCVIGFRIA